MAQGVDASIAQSLQGGIQSTTVGQVDQPSVKAIKEGSAAKIGSILVYIFGGAVFYLLTFGVILISKFHGNTNQDFAIFVRDALNPFIKECATTLGTIFGSTLGFVLGYYFKEATSASDK